MQHSLPYLLDCVQQIATDAGHAALEFYGQPIPIEAKADHSPLTQADKASHTLITSQLSRLTPDIPVISEESAESAAISRAADQWRWLVDPLDGTKEFIKQTGQFTVNIALVHRDHPVLGMVYVPVSGLHYGGVNAGGALNAGGAINAGGAVHAGDEPIAWTQPASGQRQLIHTRRADLRHLTVVASRDHAGPVVAAFLKRLEGAAVTSLGSSLKFCLVAEGKADFYPRVVPTMQWDTAAA